MANIAVNNVVSIPTTRIKFFKHWFIFLKPMHGLTDREIDVIAAIIAKRFDLAKVIKDDLMLDQVLLSEVTRKEIRESCGMTLPYFQVIMGKLKASKIIIDGRINKRFIPLLKEDEDNFKLMFYFEFKE